MRSATILEGIVWLHQLTKNPLKYVHTNSNYGYIVVIIDSDNWGFFSRYARDKGWVDKIIIHYSDITEKNIVAIAQYLSKYMFEK